MLPVIRDKILCQPIEVGHADVAAVGLDPALEHAAGAGADHVARGRQGDRRHALAIEDNSANGSHRGSLAGGTPLRKGCDDLTGKSSITAISAAKTLFPELK